MKIISEGNIPKEPSHIVTCSKCKCKFEFLEREAKEISSWGENYFEILCPTINCGTIVNTRNPYPFDCRG